MNFPIQYNIFETREQTEKRALLEHVKELEQTITRVRKALFARNGAHTKKITELEDRLAIIERGLCRNE